MKVIPGDAPIGLVEYVVKATQHIIVVDNSSLEPKSIGSGCVIHYQNRFFLISVAHVTDKAGQQACIVTGQLPIANQTPIYSVGAMNYIEEFKIENLDDLNLDKDLKNEELKKIKVLDITFVEIKESIELLQHKIDFGEIFGSVPGGSKIILTNQDYDKPLDKTEEYCFFGRVKGKKKGQVITTTEKFTPLLEYFAKRHTALEGTDQINTRRGACIYSVV